MMILFIFKNMKINEELNKHEQRKIYNINKSQKKRKTLITL